MKYWKFLNYLLKIDNVIPVLVLLSFGKQQKYSYYDFFFNSDFIHFKTVFSDQDARYRCGRSIRRTSIFDLYHITISFLKNAQKIIYSSVTKKQQLLYFLHFLIFFLGSRHHLANNHYEAEMNIRNVTQDSLRQSYRTIVVRHPFERILSGYLWTIASDEGKIQCPP